MKYKYHDKFDKDCIFCHRSNRLEKIKWNNPQPFYIVVYGIHQRYGGPEEGGWWFDVQRVIEIQKVWTVKEAINLYRELKESYPQPKHNRFSVLGGEDITITLLPVLDLVYETMGVPIYE